MAFRSTWRLPTTASTCARRCGRPTAPGSRWRRSPRCRSPRWRWSTWSRPSTSTPGSPTSGSPRSRVAAPATGSSHDRRLGRAMTAGGPTGGLGEGSRRAVVVTCSTRAAHGVYADRGGPIIVEALRDKGFDVPEPTVVADGPAVRSALEAALSAGPDLVVTTGGTGLSPTDGPPEATRAVIAREVPGIAEAIRADGVAKGVTSAMLSRGIAGAAGRVLVVNLPGS